MSGVPVPPTVVSTAIAASVSPLDTLIIYLNSNPYFIGLMMLLLNLGGRFLALEVSKEQEKFFQHPWVRRFLIFVIFFMGTRNVFVAAVLTFIAVLCIGYLFNENSSLCLFKAGTAGSTCASNEAFEATAAPGMTASGLTIEEQEIYKRLHEKQMKNAVGAAAATNGGSAEGGKKEKFKDPSSLYWQNMITLGSNSNPRF